MDEERNGGTPLIEVLRDIITLPLEERDTLNYLVEMPCTCGCDVTMVPWDEAFDNPDDGVYCATCEDWTYFNPAVNEAIATIDGHTLDQ